MYYRQRVLYIIYYILFIICYLLFIIYKLGEEATSITFNQRLKKTRASI